MNKEELLKAIEQKRQAIWPSDTHEMAPANVPNNLEQGWIQGWLNALKWMKDFINSLPAEQPSEELEIEIERYFNDDKWFSTPLGDIARHFAKWQKAQLMKSAIDGCYIKRNRYTKENVLNGLSVTCDTIQKFKDGDKVKILIIKEDEQ